MTHHLEVDAGLQNRRSSNLSVRDAIIWAMTYVDWSQPVRLMEQRIGPATPDQQALAAEVGVTLPDGIPSRVAAAMFEDHLLPRIWTDGARGATSATEKQIAFLESLADKRPSTQPPLTEADPDWWTPV